MSAILCLDRFKIMWLAEGAIGRSHLRWDIYPMMVNDIFPQLTNDEREAIFTYIKRDESWKFADSQDFDKTPRQYYLQMLARYNPANQFSVTLKRGRARVCVDTYKWDGRYYVGWQQFCDPEHICKVEQKPYNKCTNNWCAAATNGTCLRYQTYNHGDQLLGNNKCWKCELCDFLIANEGEVDPVAKMIITPKQK